MKKFLMLLVSVFAFTQISVAQSTYTRKQIPGGNVIVSTGVITQRNEPVPQGEKYIPVTILKGKEFIDQVCNKFKTRGVKGWLRLGFNSDLNGNIVSMDIVYPEALQVADKDVAEILDMAKKKCHLEFRLEGVYKYVDYVSCSYDIRLSE